jgi:hypothetical protein
MTQPLFLGLLLISFRLGSGRSIANQQQKSKRECPSHLLKCTSNYLLFILLLLLLLLLGMHQFQFLTWNWLELIELELELVTIGKNLNLNWLELIDLELELERIRWHW